VTHICNGGHGCAGKDCACPCHYQGGKAARDKRVEKECRLVCERMTKPPLKQDQNRPAIPTAQQMAKLDADEYIHDVQYRQLATILCAESGGKLTFPETDSLLMDLNDYKFDLLYKAMKNRS